MAKCSIIIPVYNKASLTRQCLDALLAHPPQNGPCEIIVVDDASTDGTAVLLTAFSDCVRFIRHAVNGGFAATCNDGAAAASGEYLVFLNNDTIPQPGWLDALVRYADAHPRAAAVGSKLLFPNNTIQHAGVVICKDRGPRHIYATLPGNHPPANRSRRFQVVTGACVLMRRAAFDHVGGFDTAFRNGFEDVDLCLRLGEKGYEIHYCHESVLYHLESVSREGRTEEDLRNFHLYRSRWAHRVQWDDLQYYLDDGMFSVHYPPAPYPLHFEISPLLAVVKSREGMERRTNELLIDRSRQEFIQMRDNIRLGVRATEIKTRRRDGDSADSPETEPSDVIVPRLLCRSPSAAEAEEPTSRLVSIILAVHNGAATLRQLLPRVLSQRHRDSIEVIAVDCGSTDDTMEVLRRFDATVASVGPDTSKRSVILNLGVRYARGSVFVFLDQGALPADDEWLANLVAQLDIDAAVAGVCSRVLPHADADRLAYRHALRAPRASAERSTRALKDWAEYLALSPAGLREFLEFHTFSAAVRAQIFRRIPFPEVDAGEDLAWAREVLEAGFKIQHELSSIVCHAPKVSFLELLKGGFDEGQVGRQSANHGLGESELWPRLTALVRDDWDHLVRSCRLAGEELEHWQVVAAFRHTSQVLGQWLGAEVGAAQQELTRSRALIERLKDDGLRAQAAQQREVG
jgi:GT2 family glycosyltransferase